MGQPLQPARRSMTPTTRESHEPRTRTRRPSLPNISELFKKKPIQCLPRILHKDAVEMDHNVALRSKSDGLKSFAFNKNIRRRHSIHRFGLTQRTPRTLAPINGLLDEAPQPSSTSQPATKSSAASNDTDSQKTKFRM